jgi:Flp pilus assembly protein TadB
VSPVGLVALAVVVAVVALGSAVAGVEPVRAGVRARQRARALVAGRDLDAVAPSLPWPSSAARAGRRVARFLSDLSGGAARVRRRSDRALPALLDHVTRQLRSGASLPLAVRTAAAASPDAGTFRMADELAVGAPLAPAVEAWHRDCPTPARALVAAALLLASEAGGAVASVLDGVTDTLRDRIALDREVAALSSQARASAAVLVVAPVAFSVLAATADHRVADVLLGHPLGWACLAVGVALDGVGALWMSRLVGRSR